MAKSTEVAERDQAGEVAVLDPAVQAIIDQQEAELEGVRYNTPILKLAQALTKEVSEGDAEAGDFINTLTGESLGPKVEFIVSTFQKGRSASPPKGHPAHGRYFVSVAEDNIPEHWADLVGEEFVGTPFSEYPDAEERYKERVNNKEIEWDSGPLISTTYVYTGQVIEPAVEGSDEDDVRSPVRIAFQRSTKSASDKILTLKRGVIRKGAFWDKVFEFESAPKSFGRAQSYIVNVKLGRSTTAEEKRDALDLAQAVFGGAVADNAAEAEKVGQAVEPDAQGGLAV